MPADVQHDGYQPPFPAITVVFNDKSEVTVFPTHGDLAMLELATGTVWFKHEWNGQVAPQRVAWFALRRTGDRHAVDVEFEDFVSSVYLCREYEGPDEPGEMGKGSAPDPSIGWSPPSP